MQLLIRIVLLGTFSCGLAAQAHAKDFKTCEGAFAFYKSDNALHKAFATSNGTIPGHGDLVCGGSGGSDLGHVVYNAITKCRAKAKEMHYSGKCIIIRKQ